LAGSVEEDGDSKLSLKRKLSTRTEKELVPAKRTEICPELTLLWAKGDAALSVDR
jgi:hypothetical protein